VLVIPFPYEIKKSQFSRVEQKAGRNKMPTGFGMFHFETKSAKEWLGTEFPKILRAAKDSCKRIDGVVLPELSLKGRAELQLAAMTLADIAPKAFLIAGVQGDEGENQAGVTVPIPPSEIEPGAGNNAAWLFTQNKHHRWQLEKHQIEHYGLEDQLPEGGRYWENTPTGRREVQFFPLRRSFAMCVLVCEDLARQEPAARLVRAVGPSLVVALLMDGQQLHSRWSGRYAAALAEDPGSAVLSVTCAGMIGLEQATKPTKDKRAKGQRAKGKQGISVGLWRDSSSGHTQELKMKTGARALMLPIKVEKRTEYSADGRSCESYSCMLPKDATTQITLKSSSKSGKTAVKKSRQR
jgi:hypothetical protein